MKKRMLPLLLALALLAACGGPTAQETPAPSPSPSVSAEPSPSPSVPAERPEMSFGALVGPSGVGASKLMADNDAGLTRNDYEVTLAAENSQIVAGLSNGEIDVAAVASNVAANLYQKTGGGVQVVAVSGLGVLYILENGDSVEDMQDLEGKTLYATGQGANPEYVLNYLLTENGVDPSEVDIQWKPADEIAALMASDQAWLCMLPVPAATGVLKKNDKVREALDLSAEWDKLENGSRLTMTTLVVRKDFIAEDPEALANFMLDYQDSVDYMTDPANLALTGPDSPTALMVQYGLVANEAIAKAALPKCALTFITGAENIQAAIQGYYEVLWTANPASIGGSLPDDGFYYDYKAQ